MSHAPASRLYIASNTFAEDPAAIALLRNNHAATVAVDSDPIFGRRTQRSTVGVNQLGWRIAGLKTSCLPMPYGDRFPILRRRATRHSALPSFGSVGLWKGWWPFDGVARQPAGWPLLTSTDGGSSGRIETRRRKAIAYPHRARVLLAGP